MCGCVHECGGASSGQREVGQHATGPVASNDTGWWLLQPPIRPPPTRGQEQKVCCGGGPRGHEACDCQLAHRYRHHQYCLLVHMVPEHEAAHGAVEHRRREGPRLRPPPAEQRGGDSFEPACRQVISAALLPWRSPRAGLTHQRRSRQGAMAASVHSAVAPLPICGSTANSAMPTSPPAQTEGAGGWVGAADTQGRAARSGTPTAPIHTTHPSWWRCRHGAPVPGSALCLLRRTAPTRWAPSRRGTARGQRGTGGAAAAAAGRRPQTGQTQGPAWRPPRRPGRRTAALCSGRCKTHGGSSTGRVSAAAPVRGSGAQRSPPPPPPTPHPPPHRQ